MNVDIVETALTTEPGHHGHDPSIIINLRVSEEASVQIMINYLLQDILDPVLSHGSQVVSS